MRFRVLNDNILVENIPHEVTGKIYVPPEFRKKMKFLQRGKVIAAGPGTPLLPMPVGPGNEAVYDRPSGFDVTVKGKTIRVIKNFHVICAR
jgi:co-chaperonin GroES (HSP10)